MLAEFRSLSVPAAARRAADTLLDLVFPPLCVSCRAPVAEAHSLCGPCWSSLSFLEGPCCTICGYPFDFDPGGETRCAACIANEPAFDRARSALRYDDASRDMILAFKRADRLDLAPAFVKWLALAGRELVAKSDFIVPVPIHRRRLWSRRFNQSAVLAQGLARALDRTARPLLVERTRPTPSQGEMPSARARRRNVRGAFRVADTAAVRGRSVLLVDDVLTTGATVDAVARALKRSGASRVDVLTLARVVRAPTHYV